MDSFTFDFPAPKQDFLAICDDFLIPNICLKEIAYFREESASGLV